MSTLSNYVAKLTTNENIYYVLTGNDFDFNLIDLEHPKLFAISNNYATESVISPVIDGEHHLALVLHGEQGPLCIYPGRDDYLQGA